MEEPVRLVCPECDAVYRVKKLTLGKAYNCKKCGSPLVTHDETVLVCPNCRARSEPAHIDVSRKTYCSECAERPQLVLENDAALAVSAASPSDVDLEIGSVNLAAAQSANANIARGARQSGGTAAAAGHRDLKNLEEKFAELTLAVAALAEQVETGLRRLEEKEISAAEAGFQDGAQASRDSVDGEMLRHLAVQVEKLRERVDSQLAAVKPVQVEELADAVRKFLQEKPPGFDWDQEALFEKIAESGHIPGTDEFVEKVCSALQERLQAASFPAGDADVDQILCKLLDNQLALTADVKILADDVRRMDKDRGVAALGDGSGALGRQIAEEVGKAVEAKVVAPVTQALAAQAPEILSHVRDDKFGEMMLRSVREAQRPLFREIAALGRGVPVWLFASLLIPLLLILGYLFLPEMLGMDDRSENNRQIIMDELDNIKNQGLLLSEEDKENLLCIEDTVNILHNEIWPKVQANSALQAENQKLQAIVAEQEKVINEIRASVQAYTASIQQQERRIRAYEIQLTRLGISPDAIPLDE